MQRFFLWLVPLLALLLACSPDERARTEAVPPVVRMRNIVFFGNSLTAGYGLPPHQAFPALIQQKIDSSGLAWQCINAGVSGETTAGGLHRLPAVLSKRRPDVFVLELGANDGLRGIPVRETTQNLQRIIEEVHRKYPDAQVVLVGMEFPFDLGPLGNHQFARYAQEFKALFRQVADKNRLPFVPFLLQGVLGRPELNLPDRAHPNAAGYRIVAENVWQVLEPVLRQAPANEKEAGT
ncbi:arylesterase [Hymenobacter latericus]|uniref:arylesterase n=1 Tax=Hymenobacter sp. YIM 151858-1 TaxID=2987688 RepID=UPI002227A582|nr:arylesterase [Hymenobacter sp. YIM 151858-1]UYZ58328.1 arylesterase [Hymenobacter sp. YIM 151858-1]